MEVVGLEYCTPKSLRRAWASLRQLRIEKAVLSWSLCSVEW